MRKKGTKKESLFGRTNDNYTLKTVSDVMTNVRDKPFCHDSLHVY